MDNKCLANSHTGVGRARITIFLIPNLGTFTTSYDNRDTCLVV